jgi:hypothetical protein
LGNALGKEERRKGGKDSLGKQYVRIALERGAVFEWG